jgi:hypothetical protein
MHFQNATEIISYNTIKHLLVLGLFCRGKILINNHRVIMRIPKLNRKK